MRDGSAIAGATHAAATAIQDGDLAAARAVLHGVFGDAPPVPATAGAPLDVDVAEAARLYAGVLAASGCARDGLGYSTSAYETACRDAQPGSDQRLRAAATHAYLLRATGDPAAAVPVGRDLARQLVARFGATDRRTLAAHADLALTLHAAGECLTGRQILHRTGELVRSTYGADDPLVVRMRDRLADLARACRDTGVVGSESAETVADHTCGQPATAVSISIADLFGDLFAMAVSHGGVETAAGVDADGIGRPVGDVPPWADRPTAGFPTVPVAGLHPTWVAASPAPVAAPHRIDQTSTVDATGSAFADRPVTHSRATFGRMRRRATDTAPDAARR